MNPYAATNAAAQSIVPGERVVWTGEAPRGLRFRARDAFLIPFSLLWCGFSIFWETAATVGHAPLFFRLWGVPFVLVGLYIVAGRFFVDAFSRARTSYALTERAAYIVRSGPLAAERRYASSALDSIVFSPSGDRGTIRFAPERTGRRTSLAGWTPSTLDAFEDVGDARRVYELAIAAARPDVR